MKKISKQLFTSIQAEDNLFYLRRAVLGLILFFGTSLYAQDPVQYGTPFAGVPNPMDVNMYQVHIRPHSAAGDLAGVTASLDDIKALGINVIYLMPIFPVGTDSKSSPSPYCIKDYKAVGSEYGTLTDMRNLVDAAHSRGMAVILDIAVNGSSWDHEWTTTHPEYYNRNGGVIQQLTTFYDIAGFNLNNTALRAAVIDAMRYWILAANIDGYRCDFANNPPLDFWKEIIDNLRGITSHKLLMFAEGDRLTNFQAGFDFNFGDKWYHDAIKPIRSGASVAQIQSTTDTEYTYASGTQQVVRYTANHDTENSESPISVFSNHSGVVVNFLVSAYMRGVPFLTSGQEVAFNQTIPWPYQTTKINWNTNPTARADYTKILNFRNASTAIRRGTMTNYSNTNVCAFTKTSGTEKVVVMANLRNNGRNYVIPASLAGTYKDAYTGEDVVLASGVTKTLSAFQYIVLTNVSLPVVSVTGVTVSPNVATIKEGFTQQLTTVVTPANASNQTVIWTSSDTSVASVSDTGLVTGLSGGTAVITATTTDGDKTSSSTITVTSTYYLIKNRGDGSYLYDAGANMSYGTDTSNDIYKWEKIAIDGTFFVLKNAVTGELANIENLTGSVQCHAGDSTWWSAQWSADYIDGTWVRIRNKWKTDGLIHIENETGSAEYNGAQNNWHSAQWQFELTEDPTLGVVKKESDLVSVTLFPNPLTDKQFNVGISGLELGATATVTVSDLNGRIALVTKVGSSAKVNHNLAAGMYLVNIRTTSFNVTKKLIVK